MRYRNIGNLRVSAVSLGCMGMSHAYGKPADKAEMIRLMHEAIELGYTMFDTAEVYGTADDPHHNEKLVGEALRGKRDKVVIATKFGLSFSNENVDGPHSLISDSSAEAIYRSVEGSLMRLQTDRIDLYYQHRIDPNVQPEQVAEVMADLIKQGKILHWGISEANEEYLRRAHAVCPVTAVQNRYSMMARWYEKLFPTLEQLNVGFVAFSPLANGLLTGQYQANSKFDASSDYRASMPQFQKESFDKNRELMQYIKKLAAEHKATASQISLAWMLCKKPWIVPIPGTRHLNRLIENAGASEITLSKEEVQAIDKALDSIPMSEVFGGSKVIAK